MVWVTKDQRKALDAIPLHELEDYVRDRRTSLIGRRQDGSIPCPYASIPGEKTCDWHDYTGCRWINGPPPSE